MNIVAIPCLRDNYAYLVFRAESPDCFVVDPSEAGPVWKEITQRGLSLRAIACTHHHHDHVGGNLELVALSGRRLDVYGHASDSGRIPGMTKGLSAGDQLTLAGMPFEVLHVPGHTSGAICYAGGGAAFTGDALFCGGCGRLFEGSPAQMHHSLSTVLGTLSNETVVYTGHEYTQANLEFARTLEPENQALSRRLTDVKRRRRAGEFCASASLGEERATNPFLRCQSLELRESLGLSRQVSEAEVFARVRALKDAA